MTYLLLKYMHIVAAVFLFGFGMGSYLYFVAANRTRNPVVISAVGRMVVWFDAWITTTAGVVQVVTGYALASLADLTLHAPGSCTRPACLSWLACSGFLSFGSKTAQGHGPGLSRDRCPTPRESQAALSLVVVDRGGGVCRDVLDRAGHGHENDTRGAPPTFGMKDRARDD